MRGSRAKNLKKLTIQVLTEKNIPLDKKIIQKRYRALKHIWNMLNRIDKRKFAERSGWTSINNPSI